MSNVCPKGHYSTERDYCSDCGMPMRAAAPGSHNSAPSKPSRPQPPSAPASDSGAAGNCPDCTTPRAGSARFCEVCRFDFFTKTAFDGLAKADSPAADMAALAASTLILKVPPGGSPARTTPPAPAPMQAQPVRQAPPAVAGAAPARLLLRIVVDPSLYTDPDPGTPCPANAPEKIFHLDLDENTVGRQYEGKGLHPEIVVQDPGISRRHLKFLRGADGQFAVLELGSANGADFNHKPLEAGVVTPVRVGDQITLGMWTRIFVQAR